MPNKSGMVKYKTNIILDYRGVREHDNLFILNCRKDEVILGLPWLWAINLEINWKDSRVMITPSNYRWTTGESPEVLEQWYLLWYMLHNKVAHIKDELYDTFKTWTLIQCAKFFNTSGCILEFVIKWMTISMIIAQEATKEKVTLPMAFKEYKDVFSKKKNPPNYHPLDHMTMPSNLRIRLYPNGPRLTCSIPSNIKPAKSSLKNTSRQGKSPPQSLPRPCHFSLSRRKKLGNNALVKIISTSITIPSRTPTLFPLSLTSLINHKDHQSSPNLTYNRNITMSLSNQRTDGKLPSPLH